MWDSVWVLGWSRQVCFTFPTDRCGLCCPGRKPSVTDLLQLGCCYLVFFLCSAGVLVCPEGSVAGKLLAISRQPLFVSGSWGILMIDLPFGHPMYCGKSVPAGASIGSVCRSIELHRLVGRMKAVEQSMT